MMLFFKRHLAELIRQGRKTQTLRLWPRAYVRPGQWIYSPGLGYMRVLAVDQIPSLHKLTRADALADGFTTRKELLNTITSIYKITKIRLPDGKNLYRIRFSAPEPKPAVHAIRRKSGAKATLTHQQRVALREEIQHRAEKLRLPVKI